MTDTTKLHTVADYEAAILAGMPVEYAEPQEWRPLPAGSDIARCLEMYELRALAPPSGEVVVVPRETLERLGDGIENCLENARQRGDKYDCGYLQAMSRDVESCLREQHVATPQASGEGVDKYRCVSCGKHIPRDECHACFGSPSWGHHPAVRTRGW